MARKSYNFYRNELSLITLAVLIGFYAFTAFDIYVNRYAHSMLSHDEGTADMALWTRYMEDYNERYRELSQDIDEQRMQELYGEDWEGLFARNANGTLNDQDISRIQTLYNTEGDPDNDSVLQQLSGFSFGEYDEENNPFQLYVIHEKENQIITLNYIYFSDIYPFYGSGEMNEERFSRSMETSINQFPTLYMFTHPQAFRPYVSGIMMDEGEIAMKPVPASNRPCRHKASVTAAASRWKLTAAPCIIRHTSCLSCLSSSCAQARMRGKGPARSIRSSCRPLQENPGSTRPNASQT